MPKLSLTAKHRRLAYQLFILLAIILAVAAAIITIYSGRAYFTRRGLRQLQTQIKPYGPYTPIIIFILIILSTLIPPLPLPIPLVEIAAGFILGFGPGFIVVWVSQFCASVAAYMTTRFIGKKFLKPILNNRFVKVYTDYIADKGAKAILVIRAAMAAPFNISFIVGLTRLEFSQFIFATALGILPETILFVYIGNLMQTTRVRLWYVLILLVILSLGPAIALLTSKLLQSRRRK